MPRDIDRRTYAAIYGPTTGDRVRLGDTDLWVEVERDEASYGDEMLGGAGKTMRDGMLVTSRPGESELDLLVSNALILDPVLGIFKGNIGVKDGRIVGIGRAGNPDVTDNVDLLVGAHTSLLPAEGLIVTPGGVDSHVHAASPALVPAALASGLTTLVSMGSGGVWDIGVNPEYNLLRMLEAWRAVPMNIAFLARGSAYGPATLERGLVAGASGFKVHEDFGAFPAILDAALRVAERADVAVALHTDSLNESGFVRDTAAAIAGRTIHAVHIEGAGGGHIPNLLELLNEPNVIASSTTPTLPYHVNAVAESFPMTMTVHRQNPLIESDVRVSRGRARANTMQGENHLHELGAISITNSDALGMGRIGEVIRRTWQLADRMKRERPLAAAPTPADNERVLQYLAKYTINPAIAHGFADLVGSLEPGKLADLVIWHPAYFGTKPEIVVKSGFVAWAARGDGNGSTRLSQPRIYREMYGAIGDAAGSLGVVIASRWALDAGLPSKLPGPRRFHAVSRTRGLTRSAMLRNATVPRVHVPPAGSPVLVDGRPLTLEPATRLPLGQLYHIA